VCCVSVFEREQEAGRAPAGGILSVYGYGETVAEPNGAVKRLLALTALRRTLSVAVLVLMDGVALLLGLLPAAYLRSGPEGLRETLPVLPLLLVGWIVLFAAFDLYERASVRRSPGALAGAAILWGALASVGAALYPRVGLGVGEALLAGLLALLAAGALRLFYEWGVGRFYRRGLGQLPAVVMGNAGERERVRRMLDLSPGAYHVAGEVDLGPDGADLSALREELERTGARAVVLAGAERLSDRELLELLGVVRLRGVRMRVLPGALALLRARPAFSRDVGLPLLEVRYPRLDAYQIALKRFLDVALSVTVLALLSPLLVAMAAAVRFGSPGPALFWQERAGADGKVFVCYMFRSMYEGADRMQDELEPENEAGGAIFKIRDDPRVTPVGRFLRRWSLDELPQLWNVLKGEMSLVGPRPLPLRDARRMEVSQRRRLSAVPGMTGLWQISGRSDLPFEEMVRLDLYYVENWSLSLDLKIIARTLGAVLGRKGAY
jgi:exopolysaccharide biosynthesis polyprenyl glycosylphosphotransferase